MLYNRQALRVQSIMQLWRCTEVAVTGLTRNQFVGLCRHKGSNPFISAGVFIRRSDENLVNTLFFLGIWTIFYNCKLYIITYDFTEFCHKFCHEDDAISAGRNPCRLCFYMEDVLPVIFTTCITPPHQQITSK